MADPARRYAARHAAVLTSPPVWLLGSVPLPAVRPMTGAGGHLTLVGRLERDPRARERLVARLAGAPGGDGRGRAPVAPLATGIAGALAGGAER